MKEYIVAEHPDFPYEEPKPQELIRCADCKYWSTETEQTAVPNMHKCTWWRTIGTLPIDFCSRAERKPPQVNLEMVKALVDRIEKQRGEDDKRKS